MNKFLLVYLTIFLSACATTTDPNSSNYTWEQIDKLSQQQWQLNKDEDNYVSYNTEWSLYNNVNKIGKRGDCYAIKGKETLLILIQNNNGVIQDVVTKHNDKRSNCFKQSFINVKYPKPPFAPFYHYLDMKVNSS